MSYEEITNQEIRKRTVAAIGYEKCIKVGWTHPLCIW